VGGGRTGNGYAFIDLIGDTTYTDYGLRIIRGNTGANAVSYMQHSGTGELGLITQQAAAISLYTTNTYRGGISAGGNFGIGAGNTSPGTLLDVSTSAVGTDGILLRSLGGGFIRMLPSASAGNYNSITSAGDTAIIFSNGTQGAGRLVIAPWASATSGITIAASTGYVGIGTASPRGNLDVATDGATVYIGGSSSGGQLFFGNSSNYLNYGSSEFGYYTNQPNGHRWYNGGSFGMILNTSNRLGIGTTNPGQSLQVVGTARIGDSTSNYVDIGATGTNAYFAPSGVQGISLETNGNTRLFVSGSGNVGIGTTNPRALLNVGGSGTATYTTAGDSTILVKGSSGTTVGALEVRNANESVKLWMVTAGTTLGRIGTLSNSDFSIDTNSTARIYIVSSSGNVAIGAGVAPVYRLVVYGGNTSFATSNYVRFGDARFAYGDGSTTNYLCTGTTQLKIRNSTDTSDLMVVLNGGDVGIGGTPSYKLDVNGDVRVNAGALGVNVAPNATDGRIDASNDIVAFSSDRRLKTNIEHIGDALGKIQSLSGFTYNWNGVANTVAGFDTGSRYVGVYAQDVQAVLPEAIKLAPFDNDGHDKSISGENYLTVQYEKLVPLLIEAIKELKAEVDELRRNT
jgi:hypothetical protein